MFIMVHEVEIPSLEKNEGTVPGSPIHPKTRHSPVFTVCTRPTVLSLVFLKLLSKFMVTGKNAATIISATPGVTLKFTYSIKSGVMVTAGTARATIRTGQTVPQRKVNSLTSAVITNVSVIFTKRLQ